MFALTICINYLLMQSNLTDPFILTDCGSVVNYTLKSPGYPSNYPNDMHCLYSVSIPHGMLMEVNFRDFDLDGFVQWCM